jgi:hypothetical protein
MSHICRGKKFVQFGASFDTSLLQTGASSKKPRGSDRERVTLVGETTIIAASSRLVFFSTGNVDQQEIRAEIWNYSGFVWPFYTLIEFSRHLMSIIQI